MLSSLHIELFFSTGFFTSFFTSFLLLSQVENNPIKILSVMLKGLSSPRSSCIFLLKAGYRVSYPW